MYRFLIALALAGLSAGPMVAQLPPLSQSTYGRYQTAIEPTEDEVAFLNIDWKSQLSNAVSLAHQSDKPLLIYVMNGHPLGCT